MIIEEDGRTKRGRPRLHRQDDFENDLRGLDVVGWRRAAKVRSVRKKIVEEAKCLCFHTCTCPRYPAFFKTRRNHKYFGGAILGGGICPLRKKLLLGPISHRRRVTYGYL
ncbi:unnamed protein product [Nezara viridula]|uniref:Uncharacterized protein n=1 Tax=Nezara viridula TaxID=85310 RepID=A0A9P0H3A7_NEZVI|nr:unnamed protein product [Nezara viridula]